MFESSCWGLLIDDEEPSRHIDVPPPEAENLTEPQTGTGGHQDDRQQATRRRLLGFGFEATRTVPASRA